ncbi:hypothetical protein BDN67DRAFT_573240 [Paxillus ammoniavirescens]|nr:hypothetical protein BDN67DRAFT_573240 [Paxillus ammoniavirescens]
MHSKHVVHYSDVGKSENLFAGYRRRGLCAECACLPEMAYASTFCPSLVINGGSQDTYNYLRMKRETCHLEFEGTLPVVCICSRMGPIMSFRTYVGSTGDLSFILQWVNGVFERAGRLHEAGILPTNNGRVSPQPCYPFRVSTCRFRPRVSYLVSTWTMHFRG